MITNTCTNSIDAVVQHSLSWLEHNNIFFTEELPAHWFNTSHARFQSLQSTNRSISQYLQQYDVLRDPNHRYELIDIDFNALFETDEKNLYYLKWNDNYDKLLNATKEKKITAQMTTFKGILAEETVNQRKYSIIMI